MSGNCDVGNDLIDKNPRKTIINESTIAITGLLINILMIMVRFYLEDLQVLVLNIKDMLLKKLKELDLWDLFHFVNKSIVIYNYIFFFFNDIVIKL